MDKFSEKVNKGFGQLKQLAGETFGTVSKTELPEEFIELEKKIEAWKLIHENLMKAIKAYLQPSSTLTMQNAVLDTMEKLSDETKLGFKMKEHPKTVIEALGKSMHHSSLTLGQGTTLGIAFWKAGETEEKIGRCEQDMASTVEKKVILRLYRTLETSIKRATTSCKQAHKARLEYDTAKSALRSGKPDKFDVLSRDVTRAQNDFEEAVRLAIKDMKTALQSNEPLTNLTVLINAQLVYYQKSFEILSEIASELDTMKASQDALALADDNELSSLSLKDAESNI